MPGWAALVFACTLLCIPASAQSVISAHSGLVHFLEGSVSIDGRAISPVRGRFPEIPEGSLLTTSEGQAEILLGPEVFLWLGRNSSMRMERNRLVDTRVELIKGSAVLRSMELPPDSAITVILHDSEVRVLAHRLYRIDAAPSAVTVVDGQTSALAGGDSDALDQWALGRSRTLAAAALGTSPTEAGVHRPKSGPYRRGPFPAVVAPVPRRGW